MEKNKRVVIIITIIILTIISIITVFKKDTSEVEKSKVIKVERKEFNIYKEQNTGKKDYVSVSDTTFPTSGYLLNTQETKCYDYNGKGTTYKPIQNLVNGVIDGSITIESSKTIYCDLYFDKNEAPSISNYTLKGKTSGNQELNNGFTYDKGTYIITWNDTDVVQYCLATDSKTCNNWQVLGDTNKSSKTITVENNTFTNTEGLKTIYAFIKDKANNISTSQSKSITVDKTAPVVTSFAITGSSASPFTVKSGYSHTKSVSYSINWNASDVEQYCISNNNKTCSSWVNSSGTSANATSPNIEDTEGNKTMYAYIKDKAGNISTTIDASTKTIYLDKSNPTASVAKGSVTTDSITVTVSGTDANGILKRECQATSGSETKKEPADTNGSCTMSGLTDGTTYTVIGIVTDKSGRVTNSESISVTTDKKAITGQSLFNNPPTGLTVTDCNGMKRFVGQCDAKDGGCDNVVNNFICLGYADDSADCKNINSDYMYRIIGITSNGEMKLIKNKPLASKFSWYTSSAAGIPWNQSILFNNINGTAFFNSLSSWQNKIMNHTWPQGDMTNYDVTADAICTQESKLSNINANIGLITLSDYYYAHSGAESNCKSDCSASWMSLKNNGNSSSSDMEWTMQRYGFMYGAYYAFATYSNSEVIPNGVHGEFYVRPVFYLSSETTISSGTGTSNDPYIIYQRTIGGDLVEELGTPSGISKNPEGGMYRFQGECNAKSGGCNNKVNNFICFGNGQKCDLTSDYMYRIIGITLDGNIKIIKNSPLVDTKVNKNLIKWHRNSLDVSWNGADLNSRLNGKTTDSTNYPNLFIGSSKYSYMNDTTWTNKIADMDWPYMDLYESHYGVNGSASSVYVREKSSSNVVKNQKIGLMYVNDYMFSGKSGGRNCYKSDSDYASCRLSWMNINNNGVSSGNEEEWTISRNGYLGSASSGVYVTWGVQANGGLNDSFQLDNELAVRPVFYLKNGLTITGSGTLDNPFVVAK